MPPIDLGGQDQSSAEMVPSQAKKTRRGTSLRESSSRKSQRRGSSPSSISSNISLSSQGSNNDSTKSSNSKKSKSHKERTQNQSFTSKGFKRHYATHNNYQDFSQVKPSESDLDQHQVARGGVHAPFPTVLHTMMEQSDAKGYSNIVSWQSHGRAFLIHQPKTFIADVLPLFFKHSKFASFQRQLSLYGFIRLTHNGPDRGAYYHPCFLRGRFFLTSHIPRTRVKGTWVRTTSSPELEPDFDKMEPVRAPADLGMNIKALQMISSTPIESTDFTCNKLLQDLDYGEAEDEDSSSSYRIHPFLHEATIRACSSVLLSSDRTTRMSNKAPTPVQLLDAYRSLKGDSALKLNQEPTTDSGLQPPPAPFPNTAVSGTDRPTSSDMGSVPFKAFFPMSSSTPAGDSAPALVFKNDDDLAIFLNGIDFENDFFELTTV